MAEAWFSGATPTPLPALPPVQHHAHRLCPPVRQQGEELGRNLHQQFIVENKPGAGTRIANDLVAHAPGDGYTILYVAAPYATAEALFGKLTYERKDLQPVAMAVIAPLFLIISADATPQTPAPMK